MTIKTSKLDLFTINVFINNEICVRGMNLEDIMKMRLIHPLFKKLVDNKISHSTSIIADVMINKMILKRPYADEKIIRAQEHIEKMNGEPIKNIESITIVNIEKNGYNWIDINPFITQDKYQDILKMLRDIEPCNGTTFYLDVMYVNNNPLPTMIQLLKKRVIDVSYDTYYDGMQYDTTISRGTLEETILVKINDQRYEGYTEDHADNEVVISKRLHVLNIDNEVISITDNIDEQYLEIDNGYLNFTVGVDKANNEPQFNRHPRITMNIGTSDKVSNDDTGITSAMYKALLSSLSELYVDYENQYQYDDDLDDYYVNYEDSEEDSDEEDD